MANQTIELLPHNREIERAILGALLIDPDAILRVREVDLQPSDFYVPSHGMIYAAMLSLADRFRPIDTLTVADALRAKSHNGRSDLDIIGGPAALTELIGETVTAIYAGDHAAIVKRLARQRAIITMSGELAALAHHHEGTLEELYDQVSRLVAAAMDRPETASHYYGSDESLVEYLAEQVAMQERLQADPDALIVTGLRDLDAYLGSIPEGTLHVPVARPGTGKTIYCECLAEHNARRGKRVAFYHYELSTREMLHRRVARHGKVALQRLREGYSGPEVTDALDAIRAWHGNIVYVHCPGWSAERVAADMTRLHARGECDLAVVDYVQKIPLPRGEGTTSMRIGQNVEVLKTCAEQLSIPIVLPSQVNRSFKGRGNARPTIADIRESGEIEEKANQILVLHRPEERQAGRPEDLFGKTEKIEIHIEKNTGGATGQVDVVHVLGHYKYASLARQVSDAPSPRAYKDTEDDELPF